MKTIIGCALVVATLMTASAVADTGKRYVSSGQEFEVTIPDGWRHMPIDGPLKLILVSPRSDTRPANPSQPDDKATREQPPRAVCVFVVGDTGETREMTQQQLNEAGENEINDDFWRQLATSSNQNQQIGLSKNSVISSRSEMRGDRRVYLATLRFEGSYKGEQQRPYDLRADMVFHMIPGRMLASNCLVNFADAASEEADFKIIADSFNPLGNTVIAGVRQSGRTTPLAGVRPAFLARGMLQFAIKDGHARAINGRTR
jgi:hypothetical protein